MSSFLNTVKDVAEKASDRYQEKKKSSSKDEGTYDPSKNDDYSSSNKQSSNEVCRLRSIAFKAFPRGKQLCKTNCSFPSNASETSRNFREERLAGIYQIDMDLNTLY